MKHYTKEELEAEWHEMAFEIYTKELQLKKDKACIQAKQKGEQKH